MRLFELFMDQTNVKDTLRQDILDILTPLVANKVHFVTVQQIIDKMRDMKSGMVIDRALVMNLLDPDSVKVIKKIEGDRIYLALPEPNERKVNDHEKEKEQHHIKDKAAKQAKKEVSKKGKAPF